MADPFTNNLTTLARRLKPFFLGAVHGAPGVAAVMLNRIILLPSSDADPGIYPKSAAGLAQALAAAVSGDAVWLPPCALGGSQTVPAGVSLIGVSRGRCTIAGQVSLGDGSKIEHLNITWAGSVGVLGPAAGTGYILGCDVITNNTGDSVAVQGGDGDLQIWDARISGSSYSGTGYGISTGAGSIYMDGGWLSGSTAAAIGGLSPEPDQVPTFSSAEDGGEFHDWPTASVLNCGVGGSPPAGWNLVGYDDSSWNTPIWVDSSQYGPPITGSTWVKDDDPQFQETVTAWRHEFDLDVSPIGAASLEIWANDIVEGVWVNGILVWAGADFYGFPDKLPAATVALSTPAFERDGTNCLAILYRNKTISEFGTLTCLDYKLTLSFLSIPNLVTNGVRMDPTVGEPAQGDRSAWDAVAYQARHANDIDALAGIHHTLGTGAGQASAGDALTQPTVHTNDTDDSVDAIHHTLGDGAGQAAPGDHTHDHTDLTGVDTDESISAIHHTLGSGATQAAAGDHSHTDTGFDANLILVDDDGAILIDDNGNVLLGD